MRTPKVNERAENGRGKLHLPSLTIKGFRGFRELNLPKLGRVTLLAGDNGVGKSAVLEAVRLFAAVGDTDVMEAILRTRGNLLAPENEERETRDLLDIGSLLFGYGEPKLGDSIKIGPVGDDRSLEIKLSNYAVGDLQEVTQRRFPFVRSGKPVLRCWEIAYGGEAIGRFPFVGRRAGRRIGKALSGKMWLEWDSEASDANTIDCEILGPGLPSDHDIVRWFENLLLTSEGRDVLDVLHLVNEDIGGLASRGGGTDRRLSHRRMIASLKGVDYQIPLRSLGDGIVRIFGLAVALINARDGFLLIDEVENGIHHSRFRKLWEFVLHTAETYNIQVIAATHSYDCVRGLAHATPMSEGIERQLIRISRTGEETWATPYTEEGGLAATEAGIEVR